ncbi:MULTISPECIES: AAA family ATPase [Thermoanaerobacterium]|uniref:CobQ/CobB/MinD/ParA nucleotide binding domain-containing protein n=2 Tax=Thermoanaerobacterium TaxID=28895 RepID=W9EC10_9THEO|nr:MULTISPECIES: AAA family ATPase [Thermoanaerobacterium]AFK85899.1 hypothetical protein Tsac_0883 [Thermoanaerobacterium saccharolyticum JW/SL-YS485]ETO38761.1 hypothetical protein V518_1183 [Thermoanaerobacterium aotearoense SCUT27]
MIISVYSPKGGVGKTTLVLSLGKLASEKLKTCVIEYDFSPGSFISLLDLERQKNILEAVNGRLDWAIQKPYKQKFDAIVGGYPDTPEYIKPDRLVELLNELDKRYDLVLIDVQPSFIEGCIDIFKKSEKIFVVIEDDFSVNARVVGNIDWARTNDFLDVNKVFYIVNKKKGPIKYINITELKFPVFYEIPYIKNIRPLYDKNFEKHSAKILEKIMPDTFDERKKFLLFRKKQKKIVGPVLDTERIEALPEIKETETKPEDIVETNDTDVIETANRIGVQNILYAPIDTENLIKTIEGVDIVYNNESEKMKNVTDKEIDCINNDSIKEVNIIQTDEGIKEILSQLQNFLKKYEETYEARIARQQEVINEKEKEIENLNREIEKYRQKEEDRKKIFLDLQRLLS